MTNCYYRTDKNFVYKGKKYPVDFMILTRFSKFFFDNQEQYNNISDIEISEDGIEISEEEIQNFICFCQFKQNEVKITHSNVFSLRHLAIKYEVPILIQSTTDYIMNNNKDLILQSLLYNSQRNQPDPTDENFISSHFFNFITNTELSKLSIPVLYRILTNPMMEKVSDMNDFHQKQLFEFIFKCLDEHKRPASVLFQIFEVDDINNDVFNRLFNEYEDIFDFNMIKSKTNIKKMSELMSKINKIDLEFSKYRSNVQCKLDSFQAKLDELTNVIDMQKNEINDLKKQIDLQTKNLDDLNSIQISQLNDGISLIKKETAILRQDLDVSKNAIDQEIIKLKADISKRENAINQSFVTKDQLRKVLQAGREKTRNISFWVECKSWTNPDDFWSNGPAFMGDNLVNWLDNRNHLNWEAFQPWDAAIASVA